MSFLPVDTDSTGRTATSSDKDGAQQNGARVTPRLWITLWINLSFWGRRASRTEGCSPARGKAVPPSGHSGPEKVDDTPRRPDVPTSARTRGHTRPRSRDHARRAARRTWACGRGHRSAEPNPQDDVRQCPVNAQEDRYGPPGPGTPGRPAPRRAEAAPGTGRTDRVLPAAPGEPLSTAVGCAPHAPSR